jgi:hypothetical protein
MISLLNETIDWLVKLLAKTGLLKKDLDCNLLRASMVIIFLLFGYQKWFIYEAKVLIPYIGNDPFLSWMYPVFGIQGASWLVARRLRVDFRRASVKPAGYTARFPHRLRLRNRELDGFTNLLASATLNANSHDILLQRVD